MRGKLDSQNNVHVDHRNIPVYAGKTHHPSTGTSRRAEHPRVCGENAETGLESPEITGTSPRMRGKHPKFLKSSALLRNIPAYAGKTEVSKAYMLFMQGTSPHTRGKPAELLKLSTQKRNIPAYAGKTCLCMLTILRKFGTSPHTRGKPGVELRPVLHIRNIPAYAGKTSQRQQMVSSTWEHPRIRGENSAASAAWAACFGTSPHTRGKPLGAVVLGFDGRNIPAYAGKTGPEIFDRHLVPETSPRMRGKRVAGKPQAG